MAQLFLIAALRRSICQISKSTMPTKTLENSRLNELLRKTARREHVAFEQLYELTKAHLFGVALRILRRQNQAEEVLQEAYINIWTNAGSYSSHMYAPMTWLISIVRNKAIDSLRNTGREYALRAEDLSDLLDEFPDLDMADPACFFESETDSRRLGGCFSKLEGKQRQSIALVFYNGLSHSELACHLELPLGTVKAWVRRGMDKLRTCMSDGGKNTVSLACVSDQ